MPGRSLPLTIACFLVRIFTDKSCSIKFTHLKPRNIEITQSVRVAERCDGLAAGLAQLLGCGVMPVVSQLRNATFTPPTRRPVETSVRGVNVA